MRLAAAAALALAACHASVSTSSPASDGVQAYLRALRNQDSGDAYDMLSADARKSISRAEFAVQWKQTARERAWQADAIAQSTKGNPDVGERAVVSFGDGKVVELERDGQAWRLESDRVTRSRARQPRDAIRLFADAIANRDITAILASLTQRRRDGLTRQVEGFTGGLQKRINSRLDEWSDRAELRWDEGGLRYRIVLRKEADEWRVDDISIRPAPKDDETPDKSGIEGAIPDDL